MSYLIQSRLAVDGAIAQRVTACAAMEGIGSPQAWVGTVAWQLSAQPGWVAAYKAAVDAKVAKPGEDESAITDSMILEAVTRLYVPPPEEPEENTPESPA